MRSIIEFFAREHLFGNLITILSIGFGIYSVVSLQRDIWPDVDFNITTIGTVLGGASPQQVEKLIINPIEEVIREVDGIKKVFSSATESQGQVIIQLDPDARDVDKTNQDIQQTINRIEDLPEDAEDPIVTVVEASQTPVIEVTITSKDNDPFALRKMAKTLADELSLMPGVARVTKNGYLDQEYIVEATPESLAKRRVSLSQLINTISLRNISVPGGSVPNPQGQEVLVRTEAEYTGEADIEDSVILANEAGFGTKIGRVAKVYTALAKPDIVYRANGNDSINLVVAKKVNADALDLVQSVKDKVTEVQEQFSDKFEFGYSNDFSVYLSNRLEALSSNLILGLLLVVIVLTLFLPWQVTLVVAVGMPVALFMALITAQALGFTLNLISLIGLIIVLGMLVDDAIVVSENIWRHVEKGKGMIQAVSQGASEVLGPVIASVLTTMSAFGPMLFMTGIFGAFVFQIPVMVILALAFSLLEVFFVMPSHFASWVGPFVKPSRETQSEAKRKSHWFNRFNSVYTGYVQWSLKMRYLMLALVTVMLAGTSIVLHKSGRFILFPPEGIEIFFVVAEAPIGTRLTKMQSLILPLEERISKLDSSEMQDYVATVGLVQQDPMDPQTQRGSHVANIRVSLTPQHLRQRSAEEIVEELRGDLESIEGLEKISFEYARQGPPQGRPISVNVVGPEFSTINEISDQVKEILSNIDGVIDVRDSFLPGKPEWQVKPKQQETAMVGLNASTIAQTVRAAFEGIVASSVRELDEEIDIRVRLKEVEGNAFEQLSQISVGNPQGNLIPLRQVTSFEKKETINSISHMDFQRLINISAEVDTDKITAAEVVSQVRSQFEELVKSRPSYNITFGGEDEDTKESFEALLRAFLFAAFIIFSLLIITFRSLLQPILILTSIPLGFMGVAYAMILHNRPFSFMAMLGMIALAGVIVNNAIVFTDFVNQERKKGILRSQSIINSAAIRLRPIVLTTVTTVCGLLPTAYGEQIYNLVGFGGGDPFIVPIALSLAWGMAFGSTMTALFFPAFIRILDDFEFLIVKGMTALKTLIQSNP